MAHQGILTSIPGLTAAANLSTKQFHAVKLVGNLSVNAAGAGEKAVGLLQNDPALVGEAATVAHGGVSKAKLGGAVGSAGLRLAADAAGALVPAATGDYVICISLESGAENDVISVLMEIGDDPIA